MFQTTLKLAVSLLQHACSSSVVSFSFSSTLKSSFDFSFESSLSLTTSAFSGQHFDRQVSFNPSTWSSLASLSNLSSVSTTEMGTKAITTLVNYKRKRNLSCFNSHKKSHENNKKITRALFRHLSLSLMSMRKSVVTCFWSQTQVIIMADVPENAPERKKIILH